jgi:hypothetical protein
MADVNVSANGTASVTSYGASVDSRGNVDLSGLVDRVMSALDSHAPNFVRTLVNTAAQVGATEIAIQGAIAGAVAALPAEMGASVAALGPFAPVAAVVLAVPELLLTLAPASAGTGCCGVAPFTREGAIDFLRQMRDPLHLLPPAQHNFMPAESDIRNLLMYSGQGATAAPCDPSEYAWGGSYTPPPAGSAEAFIDGVIRAAYEQANGCWSYMAAAEYPMVLAAAVGAWMRAHPDQPVTLSRRVRMTVHHDAVPGGFAAYDQPDQPQDNEPISVALNFASMTYDAKGQGTGWLAAPGATATIGPSGVVQTSTPHLLPIHEAPPAPKPPLFNAHFPIHMTPGALVLPPGKPRQTMAVDMALILGAVGMGVAGPLGAAAGAALGGALGHYIEVPPPAAA